MAAPHVLHPRPPFSFAQTLAFLRRFPPTRGERAIVGEAVLGAARLGGQTIGFRVEAVGDVEAPILRCTLFPAVRSSVSGRSTASAEPAGALGLATAEAALRRLGDWLGAEDDLGPFYALAEADPPFRAVVRRLYGYHQLRFFTPFENTCWAILGQRTPIGVARAAKRRLMERYGGAVEVDGQTLLAFPEPDDLAAASPEELAELVGTERKAERLLAIARAFATADPAALRGMPTDQLGRWLQELPGIGPWSVAFILLRGFGRSDAPLPLGTAETFDRELLGAARAIYGPSETVEQLRAIAERYGAWRGYWGHYLRIAS
jgi:DNA-3-methyladenine glycosylase II